MWQDLKVALKKAEPTQLKEKPEESELGFGVHFTDHMFLMKWNRQRGWYDAEICPFQDFQISPAAMVFHYGQAIFEGLKAYRDKDNQIRLFRPTDNFERMNESAQRMCMPRFSVDLVMKGLKALLYLDQDWVPSLSGATLYIRPTMIAVDPMLGVRPADEYYFYIILCPVGAYYPEGFNPTKIYISEKYVRAVKGGVGRAKTAGNYAASLLASQDAKNAGYTQVLWLDACENTFIEEVGTSNIFFKFDDQLVTPPVGGSILSGITRDSVIQLATLWEVPVSERQISIDEVIEGLHSGSLCEVFATGTAAVISPVGEFFYKDQKYTINDGKTGEFSQKIYDELQAIQYGDNEESFGWSIRIC